MSRTGAFNSILNSALTGKKYVNFTLSAYTFFRECGMIPGVSRVLARGIKIYQLTGFQNGTIYCGKIQIASLFI